MDYYSNIQPLQFPYFHAENFSGSISASSHLVKPAQGRVAKHKPRVSKRSQVATKYIITDPTNFRQIVQQVTGVRTEPVINFEPPTQEEEMMQCLPTLDTTAFMIDRSGVDVPATLEGAGLGLESFPTLESWNLM